MEELQPAIKRPDFVLGFFFEPKNGRQFMFPAPGLNATHLEGDQTWCRKRYRKFWGFFPRADFSESPYWVPLNTGSQWISKSFKSGSSHQKAYTDFLLSVTRFCEPPTYIHLKLPSWKSPAKSQVTGVDWRSQCRTGCTKQSHSPLNF